MIKNHTLIFFVDMLLIADAKNGSRRTHLRNSG